MTTDDIKLTPARERLLRAVAAGEVRYLPSESWRGHRPKPTRWTLGGRLVTAQAQALYDLKLIDTGATELGWSMLSRPATLTDAGRVWLDAHPVKEG